MNALIHTSVADVRVAPDQRSELHSQSLLGDIVDVIDREGKWYHCRLFDGSTGYIHCGYIVEKDSALAKYNTADMLQVWAVTAHVYTEPNGSSQIIRPLSAGSRVASLRYQNSWYEVEMPDSTRGWLYGYFTKPLVSTSDYSTHLLLNYASNLMGVPYLWGGTSSFALDCSGFTQLLHRMCGVFIPRNSSQQAHWGRDAGDSLDEKELKPGDLLFFAEEEAIDHVGVLMDNGRIIHAALGNGSVAINSILEPTTEYEANLAELFVTARRYDG